MKTRTIKSRKPSFLLFLFGFSILFCMFVVLDVYYYENNIHRSFVFLPNNFGVANGCKYRDLLLSHDNRLSSCDRPFINLLFKMLDSKNKTTKIIIQDDNLSANSSRNELEEVFTNLQQLSSIHGRETFPKLKESIYEAINAFVMSDLPLEGQRLSYVSDLNELHRFCDKMIGIDFEIIDNHLDVLL